MTAVALYHVAGFRIEMRHAHSLSGGAHCFHTNTAEPPDASFSVTEEEVRRQFPDLSVEDLPFAEEAALCSKLYHWLPAHDAMSMHASALCMDGRAVLFLGPSGTGKSTHARLWRQVFSDRVAMINDDEPILRFDGGAITVYGSPWQGKERLGADLSAPLCSLVALQQAAENRITRLTPDEALPCVLLQTMRPRTEEEADALFLLLDRLLRTTPVYRLCCTADTDAAVLCQKTILGGLA